MEFTDVDELCAAVRSWDLDFRVLAHPAACDKVGEVVQQSYGLIELGYARFLASIEQKGAPPAGCLTFCVPEEGVSRVWWRSKDVDAETIVVFPVGSELKSFSGPDFEIHTVSVAWETILCVCGRLQLSLPPARLYPETFCPPLEVLGAIRRRLRRLRDRASDDPNLEITQLIELFVAAWLKCTVTGRKRRAPSRAREQAMRKCLERIEHADWTELTPGVLCEIGGVGERTLQYAFRERFGLPPAAFLKMRRLSEARNRLIRASGEDLTVGEVASSLGFWHFSQFAADYRRSFGEKPSQTLERLRDG
jgi:AraC family ethanolamine operon transcriptional activator